MFLSFELIRLQSVSSFFYAIFRIIFPLSVITSKTIFKHSLYAGASIETEGAILDEIKSLWFTKLFFLRYSIVSLDEKKANIMYEPTIMTVNTKKK